MLTMIVPVREIINPIRTDFLTGSFNTTGESKATHNGVVVTSTTELAIDVYCMEVIHDAKCRAKNNPERLPCSSSLCDRLNNSALLRISAMGTRIRHAINNLDAPITIAEASFCESRINIDAVETNRMPKVVAARALLRE